MPEVLWQMVDQKPQKNEHARVPCEAGKLTSWLYLMGGPRGCSISQSNKRWTRKKGTIISQNSVVAVSKDNG